MNENFEKNHSDHIENRLIDTPFSDSNDVNNEELEVVIVDDNVSESPVINEDNFKCQEELLIEKLKQKRVKKTQTEKVMNIFKIILNVIWIVLFGLFNSFLISLLSIIECLTIIGIPFGIVLFKTIPLSFMPIGKRVITHYSRYPVANTLWLIFGGFFIAFIFSVLTGFVFLSIIGIPIAIQMFKVSLLLWAPFGSEILNKNEFSSTETEVRAYTIQYLRKNKIKIDFSKLNCDAKEQNKITKLCDVNIPLQRTFFRDFSIIGKLLAIPLFFIYTLIVAILIYNAIPIHQIYEFLNINVLQELLKIDWFTIPVYVIKFILVYATLFPVFMFTYFSLAVVLFLHLAKLINIGKDAYDLGYASRGELIRLYDNTRKLDKQTSDLIYVLYKLYEEEVLKEVAKDR